MKYRLVVPLIFLLLMLFFFAFFIKGAGGHGANPFEFVGYLLFPACLLTGPLQMLGGPPILLVRALYCGQYYPILSNRLRHRQIAGTPAET